LELGLLDCFGHMLIMSDSHNPAALRETPV